MSRFFGYDVDPRMAAIWAPLGLRPGRDGVTLTDDRRLRARYGWFSLETPLANISDAHVTGPYKWWRAVGVRLSGKDDGLTLGTTARGGLCIYVHQPIPAVVGLRPHSALTVTVGDAEGLLDALEIPKGPLER